jgi:hypothetical protein
VDIIEISKEIRDKIIEVDKIRASIRNRGLAVSLVTSEYDKNLAISIIKLRNLTSEDEIELEGEVIKGPIPISIIEKLAKGLCYCEKLELDKAQALYKSATSNLNCVLAQLNAYQTLNKHLDKL